MKMTMIHRLKTEKEYFKAVIEGRKPFEVRQNDRKFKVGDLLELVELEWYFLPDGRQNYRLSGRTQMVEITYILNDDRFTKEGYVILGIKLVA